MNSMTLFDFLCTQIKAKKEEDKMKIQSAEAIHKFENAARENARLIAEHEVEVKVF